MKISVVIPTYNCARYLSLAIDSVLRQTHPVSEILVVDDGSTDNTEEVVSPYKHSICYFRQRNAGPSAARNNGILRAKGDIVALLDADDIWFPNAVSRVMQTFENSPSVALITADKQVIDGAGNVMQDSWWAKHGLTLFIQNINERASIEAFRALLQTNFINTSLAFIRRTTLEEKGLFDEKIRFGEDWDLWLRIAATEKIVCINEILGQYRQHGSNVTHASEPMLKDLIHVNRKLATWAHKELKQSGISPRKLIGDALCNLGYWYFNCGQYTKARIVLSESVKTYPTARSIKYATISNLPDHALNFLRNRKADTDKRPA